MNKITVLQNPTKGTKRVEIVSLPSGISFLFHQFAGMKMRNVTIAPMGFFNLQRSKDYFQQHWWNPNDGRMKPKWKAPMENRNFNT